jgi:hypothetical protein
MTEPMFDHERLDVCELAGEYEKRFERTIPRFAIPRLLKPKESLARRNGFPPTRTQ